MEKLWLHLSLNGKLNGISKMYYDNGKIMMKMNFKDDELEGEAIIYDEDGKVLDNNFIKWEEVINNEKEKILF